MAAVSIPPQPKEPSNMASRRAPLASVPNAVNSPFRNLAAGTGKRTRAQASEAVYGQPPAKRQVVEIKSDNEENIDPRRRTGVTVSAPQKLEEPFGKRSSNAQPTAFERKLASVREGHANPPGPLLLGNKAAVFTGVPAKNGDNLETIRQWQRHYKRQFPAFVFYFDGVSDDVRFKAVQEIRSLAAREEKFFSKAVTHVITTRPIPAEHSSTSPEDGQPQAKRGEQQARPGNAASLLDANLQRRSQSQASHVSHSVDSRRPQAHAADVLTKARELGIKIWALEKLQRILKTMLETETGEQGRTHESRKATVSRTTAKPAKDADLEQLLRQEKVSGPADRDMTVAAQDMCMFKGFYIYIHDMDEKTKPAMVRDYLKPATKEQGKWPQFRLTSAGRCPFVEDPSYAKKLQEEQRQAQAETKTQQGMRVTRAHASQPVLRALADRDANLRRSPRKSAAPSQKQDLAKPLDPPKQLPNKRQSSAEGTPLFGSAQVNLRGLPRMIGGEPMASGMQQSNVTSAIRSQVVSSAAISSTAPGLNRRVGDSKEVSHLKRKVLNRGASNMSQQSVPSSYMNDMRAAINDNPDPPPRAAKQKAKETLCTVNEDDDAGVGRPRAQARNHRAAPRKRKSVPKEPKPGYCENCRDKFDDFDEHIASRKHRKFALTQDNWKELDALLTQLKRPHKEGC